MSHYLFVIKHCPRCAVMEEAVLDVNRQLPMEDKIDVIDVASNDSRVELLRERYGGRIVMAPVLVINNPKVRSRYGTYTKGFDRIVIDSVFSVFNAKVLLKNLIYNRKELTS